MQGTLVGANLRFSPDLQVGIDDVRETYFVWISESGRDWSPLVIGELYDSIVSMGATRDDTKRKFYGVGQKALTVSERGVMGQYKKLFLLYGTFFAVSGLALDLIRER